MMVDGFMMMIVMKNGDLNMCIPLQLFNQSLGDIGIIIIESDNLE